MDLVNTLDQKVLILLNFVSLLYISLAVQTNRVIVHVSLKVLQHEIVKPKFCVCKFY